jgi:Curlin associated repeat
MTRTTVARSTKIAFAAALMAATFGISTLAPVAPAEAGSVTINITPKGKNAKKLKMGLGILSLIQKAKNGASVSQDGNGNAVGIGQSGGGNNVGVIQKGDGHNAIITQNGGNNALGVIQFGKNTNADIAQNGGEAGLVIQGGW